MSHKIYKCPQCQGISLGCQCAWCQFKLETKISYKKKKLREANKEIENGRHNNSDSTSTVD